jgi:formylmethanofuran dehydrogenase subunit E
MSAHDDYLDPDRWLHQIGEMPTECSRCNEELPEEFEHFVILTDRVLCCSCAADLIAHLESQS